MCNEIYNHEILWFWCYNCYTSIQPISSFRTIRSIKINQVKLAHPWTDFGLVLFAQSTTIFWMTINIWFSLKISPKKLMKVLPQTTFHPFNNMLSVLKEVQA